MKYAPERWISKKSSKPIIKTTSARSFLSTIPPFFQHSPTHFHLSISLYLKLSDDFGVFSPIKRRPVTPFVCPSNDSWGKVSQERFLLSQQFGQRTSWISSVKAQQDENKQWKEVLSTKLLEPLKSVSKIAIFAVKFLWAARINEEIYRTKYALNRRL